MTSNHSAIGPALGYYYQAIYALTVLFDSKTDSAFVSIETFDDVYHNDGDLKVLHQLKHSIDPNTKISISSQELWTTLKVWCDHLKTNDPENGTFTLSTVAAIDASSPLNVLKINGSDRDDLEALLLTEANRVLNERKRVKIENASKPHNEQKKLPYSNKYKGCACFVNLTNERRKSLLKNTILNTSSFSISEAKEQVIQRIRTSTQSKNYSALAESILAWWDREVVKSLARNRSSCLYYDELQEFISRKNAELYNDGFTDDMDDMEIPVIGSFHPIQQKQLEIIDATLTQIKRSRLTEMKARVQRKIWIERGLPSASKLINYDKTLIQEWQYEFGQMTESLYESNEDDKKKSGREILEWSHKNAHNQIKRISQHYDNPDLIRGSYQLLSKSKKVGWHCDFDNLISTENEDE